VTVLLNELLNHVPHRAVRGDLSRPVTGLAADSRAVKPGYGFFAMRGASLDGARFIPDAAARGASFAVAERDVPDCPLPLVVVDDAREALWRASAAFHDFPQRSLRLVGVTGTNGKTTSTWLLASVLRAAGASPGVIGTISYIVGGEPSKAALTTPDAPTLYSLLARMREAGDDWVVMEASSHSLDQRRVGGVTFVGALFTNLTRDHLDYHGTMERYAEAKALLFDNVAEDGAAAVNFSDEWAAFISRRARGQVIPYGLGLKGPVQLLDVSLGADGTSLVLLYGDRRLSLETRLVGRFNAFNVLGVCALAYGLGVGPQAVKEGLESAPPVPGRLERVTRLRPRVYVDYAHTDDALRNALSALAELPHRKLVAVFGCGGDRDRGKRPLMGRTACSLADLVVITTDNPRSEDPRSIIEDILKGVPPSAAVEVVPHRMEAISFAVRTAHPDDIVLVAGKGHEDYQIFGDERIHFDDREAAAAALRELTQGAAHGQFRD